MNLDKINILVYYRFKKRSCSSWKDGECVSFCYLFWGSRMIWGG
ncbi:hypothetical protein E0485_23360 [Paenibacillus albiflavus]|uniref:Endothelin-like toxin domain-containing protein n=1 Tax=Paenibacillus albiflavus TaxID=2545760 RepID=A0A4R4E353_9BACL|nr:hypothetical protein E0485_23360 [Paenibacillus albiflavus]